MLARDLPTALRLALTAHSRAAAVQPLAGRSSGRQLCSWVEQPQALIHQHSQGPAATHHGLFHDLCRQRMEDTVSQLYTDGRRLNAVSHLEQAW